jgi:hypothetical protein
MSTPSIPVKRFYCGTTLNQKTERSVCSVGDSKENPKKAMVVPSGVTFLFIVKPSLDERHKKGLKYHILTKSGLNQYFKNIDVGCFDGSYIDKEGRSVSEDELKGKQMLVKVFCPESTVAIEKGKEEDFYKQIREKSSEWIIGLIQSNTEKAYLAKLEAFLYTYRML